MYYMMVSMVDMYFRGLIYDIEGTEKQSHRAIWGFRVTV